MLLNNKQLPYFIFNQVLNKMKIKYIQNYTTGIG